MSSFRNSLNIAMGGGPPYFYIVDNERRGSDMQIVRLLSHKLGFRYNIMNNPMMTGEQAIELVKYCMLNKVLAQNFAS